jgi:hypothetical protein
VARRAPPECDGQDAQFSQQNYLNLPIAQFEINANPFSSSSVNFLRCRIRAFSRPPKTENRST